jgi:hypothetical protein
MVRLTQSNKSLQATRDDALSFPAAWGFTSGPECLSLGR